MKKQRPHLRKHAVTLLHDVIILGVVVALLAMVATPPITQFLESNKKEPVRQVVAKPNTKQIALPIAQPASYGVAFGDTLRGLSDAELNKQMTDIATIGFGWLRTDFDWWALQPENANKWDWYQYDRVVEAAKAHNIKILAVLTRTPPWARANGCTDDGCAPASSAAYGKYVKQVVARYAPKGVHTWEIWNEPNLAGFWGPKANAAAYTRFLKEAYAQIKLADPMSQVISGGISSLDDNPNSIEQLTFLKQMYAAGAKPYFDSLGYHAYSYPAMPNTVRAWSGWSKISALKPSLRSIMTDNGDVNKLIWITEFGAPTDGPGGVASTQGYVEGQQPYHLTEDALSLSAQQAATYVEQSPWMAGMFWYSYKDLGTDKADNENFFGIFRKDGSRKQVYATLQELLKKQ
ncbi:MAG TPA: cellulase family glycosylhydrolase [Candidatus Saccharimonadales bacterium]|nr:cellulase family glycosylhydrolase [Candidatus Saccharimonadales bacterium]